MGYSKKKSNQDGGGGGWGHTFLKSPWNFWVSNFTLGIPNKTMLHTWKFHKIALATPLGNSKAKNQDPWKFCMIFSWSSLEIPLLFQLTPGISMFYFSIPLEIFNPPLPPCLDFFWNSPLLIIRLAKFSFLNLDFHLLLNTWTITMP